MKSSNVAPPQVSLVSAQKTSQPVSKDNARDDRPEPTKTAASSTNAAKAAVRDAGVSDEVWDQLQRDAQAERQREAEYKRKQKLKEETRDDALRKRIIQELIKEEEERKKEAETRKRLQMQGRCPVGYEWIRAGGAALEGRTSCLMGSCCKRWTRMLMILLLDFF
ncbi:aaa family [Cordyceps militaris]|uniref:Aaa family n=1 Tax=Cordyceps militaris TaxID=73501 RepID=A0A2H4SN35_CORMI|nr:aaa family [Cordyceps militaris]